MIIFLNIEETIKNLIFINSYCNFKIIYKMKMEKFIVKHEDEDKIDENCHNLDNNPTISEIENDDLAIAIKIPKKKRLFKIGKFTLDEECITRAAIVKLKLLNYPIKKIRRILDVSRMLAWKWSHFDKFEASGKRKTKLDENEKQFLLKKTEGKIIGIDAPSSRELKKRIF